MSIITTRITVGITTRRRISLGDTLISLSKLVMPLDTVLSITVVDTDDDPSAQTTVASLAEQYSLTITYIHSPAASDAAAYNLCLDAAGDYLALIHDNARADPNWLSELLTTQRRTNAEIILGPVLAVYLPNTPRWITRGNFYARVPRETPITTAYTENLLLKPAKLPSFRFTTANEFTRPVGATIAYAPAAPVYAVIPYERATFRWLLTRHIADGEAYVSRLLAAGKFRPWHMLLAITRMLKCYALMVLSCLSPINRRRWFLQGTLQLAVLRTLWHKNPTP